jgi:hypothetical protein
MGPLVKRRFQSVLFFTEAQDRYITVICEQLPCPWQCWKPIFFHDDLYWFGDEAPADQGGPFAGVAPGSVLGR